MRVDWMERILEQYGQRVLLVKNGEEREARAFLQPLEEKKEASPYGMTPLGSVDDRLWLYLGREEIAAGDVVVQKQNRFLVRSSRPYYLGEEVNHWWGVLCAEKEMADEGTESDL